MGVSGDEIASHCDQDHGERDVDALLVVTHEGGASDHPAEGALGRHDDWALLSTGRGRTSWNDEAPGLGAYDSVIH